MRFCLAIVLSTLLVAPASFAATIDVDTTTDELDEAVPNGTCSLREAIFSVLQGSDEGGCVADVIPNAYGTNDRVNVPAGTYTLTLPDTGASDARDGDLDITTSINIVGTAGDPTTTTVDANGIDRVFHIPPGSAMKVGFSHMTIRGGQPGPGTTGGGLHAQNTSATGSMLNVIVSDNSVGDNGGGLSLAGNWTITDSIIGPNNHADDEGAGIYVLGLGNLSLVRSTVRDNDADGNGGGIFAFGDIEITDSTFSGNTAGVDGGGIATQDDAADNPANEAVIVNSTISGNAADNNGGGLTTISGTLLLANVTIANNTCDADADEGGNGGGLRRGGNMTDWEDDEIKNTLIGDNFDGSDVIQIHDCLGQFITIGYNLVEDETSCVIDSDPITGGVQVDPTTITNVDPLLADLADNGGPTETHELLNNSPSPAIDAGDPTGCTDFEPNTLTTDQRGAPRPLDGDGAGGAICDIGAFEAPLCGDGSQDPVEDCDDGNLIDGDGCDANCIQEVCGNGVTQTGEACDDGGESATCDADCTVVVCGDGTTNNSAGEDCDDGGESAACDADCTVVACGDSTTNGTASEECDDGGTVDGDGCDANCLIEVCSNAVIQSGEQCDDGNIADGDGCSATCQDEPPPADGGDGGNGGDGEPLAPAVPSSGCSLLVH